MPELPEVETLRRGLEKYVVGHTIESVELIRSKQFQGDPKDIEGAKITSVERFGKGLVINLNNNYSLAIHIKLTGQLIYRNKELGIKNQADREEVPNKFTHIIFWLSPKKSTDYSLRSTAVVGSQSTVDKRAALYYNDQRQFGWIKVVKTQDIHNLTFFKELGPEFPLIQDGSEGNSDLPKRPHFDPHLSPLPVNKERKIKEKFQDGNHGKKFLDMEQFSNILSKSRMPIKPLLLDQKKMSGVGNIYANDGLYLAKIDPRRPANSLTAAEQRTLFKSILSVMEKGLEQGGASELTFVNVLGEEGHYQDHSLVYGHQGQKCKRDGTVIKKFMLASRGTYMCAGCQR